MTSPNPYQPPGADFSDGSDFLSSREVPQSIIEAMRQTKPWPTLLGVVGFICVGLFALLGIGVTLAGGLGKELPSYVGLIYLLFAPIYIFPSLFLWRYGRAIGLFLTDTNLENLGDALRHQKSFWRFAGITTVIVLGLYAVIIAGAVIAGIAGIAGVLR